MTRDGRDDRKRENQNGSRRLPTEWSCYVQRPLYIKIQKHTDLDRLFRYAELLNFGDVHIKFDRATGLRAIVAVHNLKNGPAIGGCRLVTYPSVDEALEDSMRLAQMMSYKAALSKLPHGGAKQY